MSRNYFRVSQAAPAYLLVGHTPGNTFIGRSQAYEPVYQGLFVQPADEIHALPGGTFLVRDGQALGQFVWQLPQKSILERGGIERNDPPTPLVTIPEPADRPRYPNVMDLATPPRDWVIAHASAHGRGPVWVLTPADSDGRPVPA